MKVRDLGVTLLSVQVIDPEEQRAVLGANVRKRAPT
jgi:hypothetical protein